MKGSLEVTEGECGPRGAVMFWESSVKCQLSRNLRAEFFWIIFFFVNGYGFIYLLNPQTLYLTM